MISRKALLISAPSGAQKSHDQNADLEMTRSFLMSPRGGAWAAHEIVVVNNPGVGEVLDKVGEMNADYTITWFSGKTFSDTQANRFLVLKGDFIRDTDLLNNSKKQLVLVDTCPELFDREVIQFIGKPNEFELARKMYDKWIESCGAGQVIMHGRAQGTGRPGVFTHSLLELASRVPSIENRFNLKSILAAGHEVPQLLEQEGSGPEISYSNGNIKLPFAMAMPAQRPGLPSGSGSGFSAIALTMFLLGILLSAD
jgi:hypothetical protein